MKVTMLYFTTVMRLYKECGNPQISWEGIDGHAKRVKFGEYEYSLEQAFYFTHIGGYDPNSARAKVLEESFKAALTEIM